MDDAPPPSELGYRRVAVVQIETHPAFVSDGRDCLTHPLGSAWPPHSLLELPAIKEAVRKAYIEQLGHRVRHVLEACRRWGVELVAFPEYALPADLLPLVAGYSDTMVIVAGSHHIRQNGVPIYEQLGGLMPTVGSNAAPVLFRGRIVAWFPKRRLAKPELGEVTPVFVRGPLSEVGSPAFDALLVTICMDFLAAPPSTEMARDARGELADPALVVVIANTTPGSDSTDFAGKLHDQSLRAHRPTLFASDAKAGGSTMWVADKVRGRFPGHVEKLEAGEEGVLVADLDLALTRPGTTQPHDHRPLFVPVAAATLCYEALPSDRAYLEALRGAPDGALKAAVGSATRTRRMTDFTSRDDAPTGEARERLIREVRLGPAILPPAALRAALAHGAARALRVASSADHTILELVQGFQSARRPRLEPSASEESSRIEATIRQAGPRMAHGLIDVDDLAPLLTGANTDASAALEAANTALRRGDDEGALERYRFAVERLEAALRASPSDTNTLQLHARARLGIALATQIDQAAELFEQVPAEPLPPGGRLTLALGLEVHGRHESARVLASKLDPEAKLVFDQLMETRAGRIPDRPWADDDRVSIAIGFLACALGRHATAASLGLELLRSEESDRASIEAVLILARALHGSIWGVPNTDEPVPESKRGEVVHVVVKELRRLGSFAGDVAQRLEAARAMFALVCRDRQTIRDVVLSGLAAREMSVSPDLAEPPQWVSELSDIVDGSGAAREERIRRLNELDAQFPGREPILHAYAEALWGDEHLAEAASVAEDVYRLLPGLGQATMLARLVVRADPSRALALLSPWNDEDRPFLQTFLADVEVELGRPNEARSRLMRQLERRKDDVIVRIWHDQIAMRFDPSHSTANGLWDVASGQLETLGPEALRRLASSQRPPLSGEVVQRRLTKIREVLEKRRGRSSDPMDDLLRFELSTRISGSDFSGIDFANLEKLGVVWQLGTAELRGWFEKQSQRQQSFAHAYARGTLSFEAWVMESGDDPVALANTLLDGSKWLAPVLGVSGLPDRSKSLLLGLAEWLILARLELLVALEESKLALAVFDDIPRLLLDFASLPAVEEDELDRLERDLSSMDDGDTPVVRDDGLEVQTTAQRRAALVSRQRYLSKRKRWARQANQLVQLFDGDSVRRIARPSPQRLLAPDTELPDVFLGALSYRVAVMDDPTLHVVSADFATANAFSVPTSLYALFRSGKLRLLPESVREAQREWVTSLPQLVEVLTGASFDKTQQLMRWGFLNALSPHFVGSWVDDKGFVSATTPQELQMLGASLLRSTSPVPARQVALAIGRLLAPLIDSLWRASEVPRGASGAITEFLFSFVERFDGGVAELIGTLVPAMLVNLRALVLTNDSFRGCVIRWAALQERKRAVASGLLRGVANNLAQLDAWLGLGFESDNRESLKVALIQHAVGLIASFLGPSRLDESELLSAPGILESTIVDALLDETALETNVPIATIVSEGVARAVQAGAAGLRLERGWLWVRASIGGRDVELRAAPEAILLKLPTSIAGPYWQHYAVNIRVYDGAYAALLARLAERPGDPKHRLEVAAFAVTAPWRDIQARPLGVLDWPLDAWVPDPRRVAVTSIARLRTLLSEPEPGSEALAFVAGESSWLPARSRSTQVELFDAMTQVPLSPAQLIVTSWWLQDESRREANVSVALRELTRHRNLPMVHLLRVLAFLAQVSAESPTVSVAGQTVVIRERLATHLTEILTFEPWRALPVVSEVSASISTKSPSESLPMAMVEPAMARASASVVAGIAQGLEQTPLDVETGCWLSLRLTTWIMQQLAAGHYEEGAGDSGFVEQAERERAARDELGGRTTMPSSPLDTRFWGEDEYDIRTANVLWGMLTRPPSPFFEGTAQAWLALWPRDDALNEALLALARRPPTAVERALRASTQAEKDKLAKSLLLPRLVAVPDLALALLLLDDRESIVRLGEEARLRWIEDLPSPDGPPDRLDVSLVPVLMVALFQARAALSANERAALAAALEPWTVSDARAEWLLLGLIAAGIRPSSRITGADLLKLPTRGVVSELLGALVGLDPDDFVQELEHLLESAGGESEAVSLFLELGPWLLRTEHPVHSAVVRAALALASRSPLHDDERVQALLSQANIGPREEE